MPRVSRAAFNMLRSSAFLTEWSGSVSSRFLVTFVTYIGTLWMLSSSSSSFWRTPVRALLYWWLVARCPYPWHSYRQCKLQSSGAGRLCQLFWARLFLDVRSVSSSQQVDGACWLSCGGDLLLGLYELIGRRI